MVFYSDIERNKTVIFRKIDGTADHHLKLNKPTQKNKYTFSHMWDLELKNIFNYDNFCYLFLRKYLICETKTHYDILFSFL